MSTIQILPPELAVKIAAGEVVERPSAIVKELIDNAIDAGATTIRIEIRTGGQDYIRVIDDGQGIASAEIETAFQRHATSKITQLADLFKINTLGFRGEALPSIASVSKMSMVSRTEEQRDGIELRYEGGVLVSRDERVSPRGTIVTVEDLFYNVPARQKFLKSPSAEAAQISGMVAEYALAYPSVRFTLVTESRTSVQTSGNGNLLDVVRAVYGAEIAGAMLAVGKSGQQEDEDVTVQVSGYVSSPATNRGNRDYLNFAVNHRPVNSQTLSYAVEQCYSTLLMTGRHPIVVLNIALDPELVDANVHPQKVEVKFADERSVFMAVQRAVRQALASYTGVPQMQSVGRTSGDGEQAGQQGLQYGPTIEARAIPPTDRLRDMLSQQSFNAAPRRDDAEVAGADDSALFDRLSGEAERATLPNSGEQRSTAKPTVESRKPLPELRVLGVLAGGYIVAEGPEGMYLMDAARASERVNYELILAALRGGGEELYRTPLAAPLTAPTTPTAALAARVGAFADLGFVLAVADDAVVVTAVPKLIADMDASRLTTLIAEMCADVMRQDDAGLWRDTLAISLASHSAVAAGVGLDLAQARELITQLESCQMPRASAQGLPTVLLISNSQLEREFKRTGY